MGKLTRKEAEELHKIGRLDDETMEVLENEGLVSRRARGVRRVMKTKNGNYVTPQLYFRGLNNNVNNEYSKKMTELMGGKMEVESDEGKGTSFSITIPLGIEEVK